MYIFELSNLKPECIEVSKERIHKISFQPACGWWLPKYIYQIWLQLASIEFFYNSPFSAKSWQNPASMDKEEQNKKLPLVDIEPTTSWSSL